MAAGQDRHGAHSFLPKQAASSANSASVKPAAIWSIIVASRWPARNRRITAASLVAPTVRAICGIVP
ncbi:MAG: hypothetical protein ACO3CS_12220, partial [Alphaproteobacteria bacterium]